MAGSPGGVWGAALMIAAAACVTDLYRRRVPNVLTFGGAVAAIVYHLLASGVSGLLLTATGGWVAGVVVFLPLFLLRGMGAGDVKLLGALGAWVGVRDVLWIAVYTVIAGGIMALIVAAWHGRLRHSLRNVGFLVLFWRVAGIRPLPELTLQESSGLRLPYAVPILAGAIVRAWTRA